MDRPLGHGQQEQQQQTGLARRRSCGERCELIDDAEARPRTHAESTVEAAGFDRPLRVTRGEV